MDLYVCTVRMTEARRVEVGYFDYDQCYFYCYFLFIINPVSSHPVPSHPEKKKKTPPHP